MQQTKAVIFDLYETLITEFSNGRRKVSRTDRDYQRLIGLSNDEFQMRLYFHLKLGMPSRIRKFMDWHAPGSAWRLDNVFLSETAARKNWMGQARPE